MIITRQKSVPWTWVALAHLPWAAMLFASAANTIVFTLEIRKFTANPAAIASLLTFTGFLTLFTGPLVNWVSDRIWTRWGRRKVFYVPAVLAQATLILFVPFAPSLGWLAFLYVLQFLALSFKAPNEVLNQEIIPNHQRGRAAVFNKVYVQFGLMAYNLALIGRFDDILPGTPLRSLFGAIRGETLIFVIFSLALLSVVLLVSLGIREMVPPVRRSMRAELGGRITPWRIGRQLFLDVFSSEWWPLYLLALSQAMYGIKLGGMVALMYTDQWGYSTQVLGFTQGTAQLVSIGIVMLVFPIADRFDKLKFYLICVWLGMIGKILWYAYVMLLVPDRRPSVTEILLIGEGINILGQLAGIVSYPLVYEFIPLDKLGTASAGLGIFRGLLGMVLGPLMGVWLLYYSQIFMPGAGSEVVVVLSQPASEEDLGAARQELERRTGREVWLSPHRPWGTRGDASAQWAIRFRDADAEALQGRIADEERALTQVQREIDSRRIRGETVPEALLSRREAVRRELNERRAELAQGARAFRTVLRDVLGERLASAENGIRAMRTEEGRFVLEATAAFPIDEDAGRRFATELAIKVGAVPETTAVLIEPVDRRRFTVRLDQAGSPVDAPAGMEELRERAEGLAAELPAAVRPAAVTVSLAVAEVVAGARNGVLAPFAHAGYQPHKVDYFSSYLLMAATDVVAILIAVYLMRAERRGKIQPRGKLEDERARAGEGAKA